MHNIHTIAYSNIFGGKSKCVKLILNLIIFHVLNRTLFWNIFYNRLIEHLNLNIIEYQLSELLLPYCIVIISIISWNYIYMLYIYNYITINNIIII